MWRCHEYVQHAKDNDGDRKSGQSNPSSITPETLITSMQVDKKRDNGEVRFALPATIGDVRTGIPIQPSELIKILKEYKVKQP